MAKRELSSTLKNLKFMQRAAPKVEKSKVEEEEVKPDGNFASSSTQIKKCVVITEGNPHPGAIKGRMSFQSFNPSVDKWNEEAANPTQPKYPASATGDRKKSERENGSSSLGMEASSLSPDDGSDGDHKRKQPEDVPETQYPNKSTKNASGVGDQRSSSSNRNGFHRPQSREKLDWNVLRPPKAQNRKG